MKRWLSFYYPTTVFFVDDDKIFSSVLKKQMISFFQCETHDSPKQASEILLNRHSNILDEMAFHSESHESDNLAPHISTLGFKWQVLQEKLENPNRMNDVSVVVVDYMMPELNGVDFCRILKKSPIKKIMLTGNADHAMAVRAFNEGLIDGFIVKDSENLVIQLSTMIKNLQYEFFLSQVDRNLGGIREIENVITDSNMISFYETMVTKFNAVEYCLLDKFGSLLLVNQLGQENIIAISHRKQLKTFAEIAEDQGESMIASELAEGNKLIYFKHQTDTLLPASSWKFLMHQAYPLPQKENTYYAII